MKGPAVLAIGASSGGIQALQALFQSLPAHFPLPMVVVLHFPPDAAVSALPSLAHHLRGQAEEARDKTMLRPGTMYLCPPGYHILLEDDGTLALSMDPPVHFSRPSIDVFFESVARSSGPRSVGVLLTGASADGAQGLKQIHLAGGFTVVQDPADAQMPVMPAAALSLFRPDHVLPLARIGPLLADLSRGAA